MKTTWKVTYRDVPDGTDHYEFVQAGNKEQALKKFKALPVANQGFNVYIISANVNAA